MCKEAHYDSIKEGRTETVISYAPPPQRETDVVLEILLIQVLIGACKLSFGSTEVEDAIRRDIQLSILAERKLHAIVPGIEFPLGTDEIPSARIAGQALYSHYLFTFDTCSTETGE